MNMVRIFSIFLLILISSCHGPKGIVIQQGESVCVPKAEFSISGITNDSSKADVISLKGQPKSIKPWEDIRYETLIYGDMTIDISNDHVLYLETDSIENRTPSGIRPGLKISDVFQLLGIDTIKSGSEYQFINCDEEYYLVLTFDKGVLRSVGMGIDAP
jgi:hypothetical protein